MNLAARYRSAQQHDHAATPEQSLWGEVVARAVQDVGMWCSLDNRERLRSKEAARWLFNPLHQKDMQEVCSYAEVCPELVKGLAKRLWLERLAPNLKPYHQSMWREVVGR